jgi:hypothetical protein
MRPIVVAILLPWGSLLSAQVGGIAVYDFLNLPNSAAVAALGGHHIALQNEDLSLAARNPGLLNPEMDGQVSLSHAFLPAGIHNSYLAYAHEYAPLRTTFHGGLQYVNYGNDLVRRDATGQDLGTFGASDFALTVGAGHRVEERLTAGANLKLVASQLAGYSSYGVALDAGVHYVDTAGRFGISLVARNFGRQLSRYEPGQSREAMPFELQIGINRELKYLPFRFSVIYRYLDRWNVLYDDPDAENLTILDLSNLDGPDERGAGELFFDNLARHFVLNGELLVGKRRQLALRVGYNHGMRRELRLTDFRSAAGYSFGFSWRTALFSLAYGRTTYHLAGGVNQLTVSRGFR